jgi:Cd2+/Zn2+-exporting ATPase
MVAGMITLSDTLRAESKEVLADLRDLGVQEILILSGDTYQATQKIALQVGVNDFRAELMPEEKLEILRSARQRDRKVGMVGDGINDAPALAAADVGIAMGGAGTDVALEAADVALMASSLEKLPYAVSLGKATRRVIIQNLVLAISVIVLLGGAALGGWAGIGPVVLLHEGSTLVVVLNALRLLRFSPNVATR